MFCEVELETISSNLYFDNIAKYCRDTTKNNASKETSRYPQKGTVKCPRTGKSATEIRLFRDAQHANRGSQIIESRDKGTA
jgi:hypothetical protein